MRKSYYSKEAGLETASCKRLGYMGSCSYDIKQARQALHGTIPVVFNDTQHFSLNDCARDYVRERLVRRNFLDVSRAWWSNAGIIDQIALDARPIR